jgi:hypothetical protein
LYKQQTTFLTIKQAMVRTGPRNMEIALAHEDVADDAGALDNQTLLIANMCMTAPSSTRLESGKPGHALTIVEKDLHIHIWIYRYPRPIAMSYRCQTTVVSAVCSRGCGYLDAFQQVGSHLELAGGREWNGLGRHE